MALPDPAPNTPEHDFAIQRNQSTYDINLVNLPQGPDDWAYDIYERVDTYERKLVAPHRLRTEYGDGTAETPDEIAHVVGLESGFLLTAEHATKPIRDATGERGFADAGTGGLVAALASNQGQGLVMTGKQTSNPSQAANHPMKEAITELLPGSKGFVSVHGMAGGKFMHPHDTSEIQASIGLGHHPTEEMYEFAKKIVKIGRETLGLYVVIGNDGDYFVQRPDSTAIKRNEDGTPFRHRLAALWDFSTTNFTRREANRNGLEIPVLQLELSWLLAATQLDFIQKDKKSQVMGVALGYKLLESVVDLQAKQTHLAGKFGPTNTEHVAYAQKHGITVV